MNCKDQSITYLKSFGYNVIRLPRAEILPLQIFVGKKKTSELLGDLSTVLKPNGTIDYPAIKKDTNAATINGQKTSDLSVGLGLNILGNIIGAMGGGKLGLDVGYKQAKKVQFSYTDVLEDSIQITELDKYLANADVDPSSRHVGELLEADDIYVITSVIKTNKITVEAKQPNNVEAKVEVPVIKEVVGGSVAVTSNNQNDSSLTFAGQTPLVFGFKAVRLFYDNGSYKWFDPVAAGARPLSLDELPEGNSLFMTEGAFANLAD